MALDEPTKKMSKSGGPANAIYLLDTPEVIKSRIMKATTDSGREVVFDADKPGLYNLLTIYQLFQPIPMSRQEIEAQFAGQGYGTFKKALVETVVEGLRPIRERFAQLEAEPAYIEAILKRNADILRPIAAKTLADATAAMGLS